MNCNCVKEMETSFKSDTTGPKGEKVLAVDIPIGMTQVVKDDKKILTTATYTEAKVMLEGRARPVSQSIVHSYCPFCGTKI